MEASAGLFSSLHCKMAAVSLSNVLYPIRQYPWLTPSALIILCRVAEDCGSVFLWGQQLHPGWFLLSSERLLQSFELSSCVSHLHATLYCRSARSSSANAPHICTGGGRAVHPGHSGAVPGGQPRPQVCVCGHGEAFSCSLCLNIYRNCFFLIALQVTPV